MKAFCPFCEKEYSNLEVQTRYEITTLNGVTAEWQKKYISCPDCGEELYNGKLHDANLRVVYAACKVSDIGKPVEDLCNYVLKLRMENAELRARLEKAVELPVKVGDKKYRYTKTTVFEQIICGLDISCSRGEVFVKTVISQNQYGVTEYFTIFGWQSLCDTYAEAEARLKEIRGGEQ